MREAQDDASANRRILSGIFLTSLAVLALELALTRLFSATMYYHFAFLAISVALFGSAAAGVFVYLAGSRLRWPLPTLMGASTLFFAISILVALLAVLANPLAENPDGSFWVLTRIYLASALPFFFAGITITLAISRLSAEISRVYFFDLAGAAAGCLVLIPMLDLLGAVNAVLAIAVVASIAALLFSSRPLMALAPVAFIALLAANVMTDALAVRWAKGVDTTSVLFSKWNSFSHITVSGHIDDPQLEMLIDADAGTKIVRGAGLFRAMPQPPVTVEGLAHLIKKNADMLIIGPGGGIDVLVARIYGQKQITAVEVNPIIAHDVMQSEPFRSYSANLYGRPDVRLVVDEGRSFIRHSPKQYDIIQATMVDTWAATAAGAFALAENNLYTVEAFEDYIRHLAPGGVLSMTRWYFEPPDQLMRIIAITRVAMKNLGIADARRHFILVRRVDPTSKVAATLLFKKDGFSDAETMRVETAARAAGLFVVYSPHTNAAPAAIAGLIESPDPSDVWTRLSMNVAPTTDNSPFFFNTVRLARLGDALRGDDEFRKTNLGMYVLMALLVISAVMVLLFIIGPLIFTQRQALQGEPRRFAWLAYFAALGAGFILVEVAMIQKFILFLGHPVYALTVVLFSLLLFSGIGSFITRRIGDAALLRVLAAVAVLIAIYIVVLPPVLYGLVHLQRPLRIALTVVLIAPLAIVMGMPMPMGIRIASQRAPAVIPWAWGLNGATSVLGSVMALALALMTGFSQVLAVGAAFYLLAIAAARSGKRLL
jgi:predicted membrane-bound spermidine synthase